MEKREEVLQWLNRCDGESRCRYTNCPYDTTKRCVQLLHADAVALLKAQEPVKPVFERQFMTSIEIYDCGKCGTSLGAKGIAKYCMKCGQAVAWK